MDTDPAGLLKRRDIRFRNLDPDANDATEAMQLLLEVKGIEHIMVASHDCMHIHYDLRHISLNMIESALTEVGFHLDDSLVSKMKRALFYYIEETQLMNLGQPHDQANSTIDVFINCYNQRRHGCRDHRPTHLRHYS